jgi:hypothetical protein
MKGILPITILCVVALTSAPSGSAQWKDFLGAHLNHGRGCLACHTAHSPSYRISDGTVSTKSMLWGEDVTSTYETQTGAPLISDAPPESTESRSVLVCLSCHSGNYAPPAMMKDTTYEKLPYTFAEIDSIPTFADKPAVNLGDSELAHHPIGHSAKIGCGTTRGWDCLENDGLLKMAGPRSSQFAAHYGFFVHPQTEGSSSVVVCTTCQNPHSMNLTRVSGSTASDLFPPGVYPTKHFLRAPSGEGPLSRTSNLSAQFCRQCHANLSNEMNGSIAGTIL